MQCNAAPELFGSQSKKLLDIFANNISMSFKILWKKMNCGKILWRKKILLKNCIRKKRYQLSFVFARIFITKPFAALIISSQRFRDCGTHNSFLTNYAFFIRIACHSKTQHKKLHVYTLFPPFFLLGCCLKRILVKPISFIYVFYGGRPDNFRQCYCHKYWNEDCFNEMQSCFLKITFWTHQFVARFIFKEFLRMHVRSIHSFFLAIAERNAQRERE